ncbi:MAG: radical SAM protein [Spirochaetaceae bacterium]|jgi:organic radical activating enzyme|nr:radical SAM protein [Spirochaetaceae bacterium]
MTPLFNRKTVNAVNAVIKKLIPENSKLYRSLYFFGYKLTAKMRLKRRTLLRVDIHITDHCNLNCKCCDNFSPIADEKYLEIDAFERDLKRISELTNGKIEDICLLGGEPLLHPHITQFFDIARTYFKNGTISIITNGILLAKQNEEFWQSCKKNNIAITITKYPIRLPLDKIKEAAKKYSVKLETMYEESERGFFCRPLDVAGLQNAKNSFKVCYYSNRCIHLRYGKIACPTVAYINYFNSYFNQNLQVTENDYIDIYKVDTIDEIFEFLCKPIPFCKYCNFKAMTFGNKWAVSKKQISEW